MKVFFSKQKGEKTTSYRTFKCASCMTLLDVSENCGYIATTSDWIHEVVRCFDCGRLNVFERKFHPKSDEEGSLQGEIVQFQNTYDSGAGKRKALTGVNVSCALIEKDGALLLCKRGELSQHPGKWEFPGGKQKSNENSWEALVREIDEELGVTVALNFSLAPVMHSYDSQEISLQGFVCRIVGGELNLKEHSEASWVKIYNLGRYDILAADIDVLEQYLSKRMSN